MITMDVQNYRVDSIQEYFLTAKVLHGKFHDDLKNYDFSRFVASTLHGFKIIRRKRKNSTQRI